MQGHYRTRSEAGGGLGRGGGVGLHVSRAQEFNEGFTASSVFFSPTNLQSAGRIESVYLVVFFSVFSAALLPDFI